MGIFDPQPLPSSPTSQQTTSGGIASWAQPYVTNMLNQAQQLAGQGPTDLQNQVYAASAGMQTPGQFAQGTGLLNQAGQGMLSTTGQALDYGKQGFQAGQTGMGFGQQGRDIGVAGGAQYGQQGAGYGAEATGAGQRYQQMATSPEAMGAYMNPYIQQSLAPQLAMLNQQQALAGQDIAAKATGAGAFGGNRATLAQGLSAQNFDLARQQAIGQGYNQAFQQAQQAQQFGANLGLQGLQTGIQGAGLGLQGVNTQLAGTAQGMQGAGLGIQGAQAGLQGVQGAQAGYAGATQAGVGLGNIGAQQGQYGLGQLALQNQIANQQYNLPFQRAQFMQGMLSGLPVATQTTQGWQSGPSRAAQAAGLGTTLIGGIGALNKAGMFDFLKGGGGGDGSSGTLGNLYDDEGNLLPSVNVAKGGQIKGGGVKRYADGGDVQNLGMNGLSSDMGMSEYLRTHPQEAAGVYASDLPTGQNTLQPIGAGLPGLMPAPQQDNSAYLNSLYSNYLGRDADQAGFQHNLDLLNSGKIDQQGLANAFMNSAEAQAMPRRYQLMGAGMPSRSGLADLRLHQLLG